MNINDMKIGVIDIETTGFFDQGGFIVEIGMVSLDTSDGTIIELMSEVCRERGMTAKDRDAWIFHNSDLTVKLVREAKDLQELVPELQSLIDSVDACTAYNKVFDFTFLQDRGVVINKQVTCPMIAATGVCKLEGFYGDYKYPKVEEAWDKFFPNEKYVELHRGLDDAVHEAHILQELISLGKICVEN